MAVPDPPIGSADLAIRPIPQAASSGTLAGGKQLDEEAIDDLLYLARTNDVAELQNLIDEFSAKLSATQAEIAALAFDPESGNGCLHMSAGNGHLGASPMPSLLDWPNQAGNTALHYAAINGQLPAVRILVAAGADPRRKNAADHDAIFEAEQAGKDETVGYLLSVGQGGEEEKVDAAEVANGDPEMTVGQEAEDPMKTTNC